MQSDNDNNNTSKENQKIFSTPKFENFNQEKEKENNSKNNSLIIETSSLDESKKYISKNIYLPYNKEEIKESKDDFNFKENFSLSSLFNNVNNNTSKNFIKDNNDQNNKALISFCDKTDNNSFNNENNEIIYMEKVNNSSMMSNKEKEEKNIMINSFNKNYDIIDVKKDENIKINEGGNTNDKNIKKEDGGNTNFKLNNNKSNEYNKDNSIEINNLNIRQNSSGSFKYNLPLERDKISFINGYLDFEKNKNFDKILKASKSLDLENNNFNTINNENKSFKINIKKNNLLVKKYNITYSKKKVKRNNTEKVDKTYKIIKILTQEKDNNNEVQKNKNLIEKGINKITIKKNILHSWGNYDKTKKKIKKPAINISLEGNKEKDEIFFPNKTKSSIISPKKKLKLIIKKTKIDLNNDNTLNKKENNFSSREKLNKIKNNSIKEYNEKNINYFKKNFNSFSTNQKKNKNKKLIKSSLDFHNTFFNFKVKKIMPENHIEENNRSNNILKEHNNNNSIERTYKTNNKNKNEIYKKNKDKEKKLIDSKDFSNIRTRNTNNLYLNKVFNGFTDLLNNNFIFNSINYEDNSLKTYINSNNISNTFLHTQEKPKIEIKSSLLPIKMTLNKKIKFTLNKQYTKVKEKYGTNYKKLNLINNDIKRIKNTKNILYKNANYIKNNKKNNNKFSLYHKFNKIDFNKIKNNKNNNSTYNKPNNLVFNNTNKNNKILKKEKEKQSYNKHIFNQIIRCNTDRNNKDSINKKHIHAFTNINSSSNSLKSCRPKIKVNMLKKHNKVISSPKLTYNSNQKNNVWKIYKKPKNSCLLNRFTNEQNSHIYHDNNFINKNNKGNSQFVWFKENKINNNIKDNDNSSSYNTNYYLNSQRNDSTSINDTINKEKISYVIRTLDTTNIYQNSKKINKRNVNRNKSNKIRGFLSLDNNNSNNLKNDKISFNNNDIIKLSILRNNLNNKIIKEFSVVVGDDIIKKENNSKENESIIKKENEISNINKKTIINFNQYYPSYFITANEIMKKNESKK